MLIPFFCALTMNSFAIAVQFCHQSPLQLICGLSCNSIFHCSTVSRGGGGYSSFRKGLMLEGAGGPVALQTSPPVRRPKSVDTDPHAALAGLTCRASPANSSIAGGAALDSVRLRRNCSLLLCETQSSSLTCARGADRAWAREKAGLLREIPLAALTALGPARRPGY